MRSLRGPLPAWDLARRQVDVAPLTSWMLEQARGCGAQARSLETLHEVLPDGRAALALCEALAQATLRRGPRALLHGIVRAALPELPWDAVAIQVCAAFRILMPADDVSPVPMHSDHAIGHSLDERNVWIALSDAHASAALHALSFAESMAASAATRTWSNAGELGAPVDVERGDVLLFTPLHLHGARVVREPCTRVSVDVRIAPLEAARARNPAAWIAVEGATSR